jgi:putative chromate ion transporter
MTTTAPDAAPAPVRFREALRFWLRLGFISFGGPAGQIAVMHAELVERRRWISERRFLHALNYCMLLPGPEAQQLAIYLGWLMHRTAGGIAAGTLFVLPSLFILIALSWVYLRFGSVPLVAGVFFGLKPAVTAVVGVILSLALFFAAHVLWPEGPGGRFDAVSALITAGAALALFRFKVGVMPLLAVCALAGLAITLGRGAL